MKKFHTTVDINATAAVVWAILSDVEAMPQWTESISNVRRQDRGSIRHPYRAVGRRDVAKERL